MASGNRRKATEAAPSSASDRVTPQLETQDLVRAVGSAEGALHWFVAMLGPERVLETLIQALAARTRRRKGIPESDTTRALRFAWESQPGGPPRRQRGRPKRTTRHDDTRALEAMLKLLNAREVKSVHEAAEKMAPIISGFNTTHRARMERLLAQVRHAPPESVFDPIFTMRFFTTKEGQHFLATLPEARRVVAHAVIRGPKASR